MGAALGGLVVALAGCSLLRGAAPLAEPVRLLAVMPIERVEPLSATDDGTRLEPGSEKVVTAQIYRVLAGSPEWRFVPDLTVTQSLQDLDAGASLPSRARALGKAVDADAVLFGTVSRYREREGGEFGARQPAAVGFELQLVSVASGTILWRYAFDQTQRPLSENLFNWWQFWRGGPRWFTAREFAYLGVEHGLADLAPRLP